MSSSIRRRLGVVSSHVQEQDFWSEHGYTFQPGALLEKQICIITGAGSGIGRQCALLFAAHGAFLCLCDIDQETVEATAKDVGAGGRGQCIVVVGDVTDENFAKKAVDATIKAFNGLHILLLNAGYTFDGVIHKMSETQWNSMLDVHCTAPFRMIQAAAPHMRDAAKEEMSLGGRPHPRCIITVSSVSGLHGNAGQINYATAKAGIVGFTKALAKEWGLFQIRANSLVFGHIETRLVQDRQTIHIQGQNIPLGIPQADTMRRKLVATLPLGRVGQPEEAAGAALLLASPYASYITGEAIHITGGGWM